MNFRSFDRSRHIYRARKHTGRIPHTTFHCIRTHTNIGTFRPEEIGTIRHSHKGGLCTCRKTDTDPHRTLHDKRTLPYFRFQHMLRCFHRDYDGIRLSLSSLFPCSLRHTCNCTSHRNTCCTSHSHKGHWMRRYSECCTLNPYNQWGNYRRLCQTRRNKCLHFHKGLENTKPRFHTHCR